MKPATIRSAAYDQGFEARAIEHGTLIARTGDRRTPPDANSLSAERGLLDAVLLELVVERAGLDAEQARGLGLHPARPSRRP